MGVCRIDKNSLRTIPFKKKTDISFVEPQLWANARESVFEKMPFLTSLNKNVRSF